MRSLAALLVFAPAVAGAVTFDSYRVPVSMDLSGASRQMVSALKNSGSPASIYLLADRMDRFERDNKNIYEELIFGGEMLETSIKIYPAKDINENLLNFVSGLTYRNEELGKLKADADAAVAEAQPGTGTVNAAQALKFYAQQTRTHVEGMRAGASELSKAVSKHQDKLGMEAVLSAAEIIRRCDALVATSQAIVADADKLLAKSR